MKLHVKKSLGLLALVTVLATSMTACLKDKTAETTTEETAVEQTAPTEGQPTEAPPADAGTTQSN